ncbi:MAG: alpha/beta fold hydrolase [Roseobacter sp.]
MTQDAVQQFGRGPRPVLALHCTLARGAAWRRLGACLADQVRITAPDLPGHGKGPAWSPPADYLAACETAIEPYLQGPIDLVGHSFGAIAALHLARTFPERVRSLVLFEPVLFAAARANAPDVYAQFEHEAQGYTTALAQGDMTQGARLFNRMWGDGTRWDAFPQTAQHYMTDRMPIVVAQTAHVVDDVLGVYRADILARVTMPCLLLNGDQSPAITATVNQLLQARLPNARSTTIAGAGHMAPITHAAEVAAAISAFFTSS